MTMSTTLPDAVTAYLAAHRADDALAALVDGLRAAEERLSATRARLATVEATLRSSDDALAAAATEDARAAVIAGRGAAQVERAMLPEQVRRDAEAAALAGLRLLRAVRHAARAEHDAIAEAAAPHRATLDKIGAMLLRDGQAPKPHRMGPEERAELQAQADAARAALAPLEARRRLAETAWKVAQLAANTRYGDQARRIVVNLETSSETTWSRAVAQYAARAAA